MNDEYTPDFVLPTEGQPTELRNESTPTVQQEQAPFAAPAFEPSMLTPDEAPKQEPVSPYQAPPQEPVRPVPPPPGNTTGGYVPAPPRSDYTARPRESTPTRKSRYAIMTTWGVLLQVVLMSIPGLGFLLTVIWALGGCRKVMRRNIARAHFLLHVLLVLILMIGVLVLRFFFPDVFVDVFEYLFPGYTIRLY